MNYIAVELHKKTITSCMKVVVGRRQQVVTRRRFYCQDTTAIRE